MQNAVGRDKLWDRSKQGWSNLVKRQRSRKAWSRMRMRAKAHGQVGVEDKHRNASTVVNLRFLLLYPYHSTANIQLSLQILYFPLLPIRMYLGNLKCTNLPMAGVQVNCACASAQFEIPMCPETLWRRKHSFSKCLQCYQADVAQGPFPEHTGANATYILIHINERIECNTASLWEFHFTHLIFF